MPKYEVNKISDKLYCIKEDFKNVSFPVFIYLVVGENKAALIDTGVGSCNLRKTVEEITKLPVIVLHTHSHSDHTGADRLFGEIYMNPKEYEDGKIDFSELAEQRNQLIQFNFLDNPDLLNEALKELDKGEEIQFRPIYDGDIIDLGEISLEAVSTPGHTDGCISYVCKEEGFAFTGDGIADIHWFDTDDSIGVEGFYDVLNHFRERASMVHDIYATHMPYAFSLEMVDNLIKAANAIMNGSDDPIENADYNFLIHGDLHARHEGKATIYYNKSNIKKPM